MRRPGREVATGDPATGALAPAIEEQIRWAAAPPGGGRRGTMFPRFDRHFFTSDQRLSSIGSGALGGKAMGLALIRDSILPALDVAGGGELEVVLPRLTVIATDVFDAFMERNHLADVVGSGAPDDRIAHAFQLAELPVEVVGDLHGLMEQVRSPLAVRSSSLLEDALAHPFAGVYGTKMIPNNQHGIDARFSKLVEAIKFVYASTYFTAARAYREGVGVTGDWEKMAVIIQEVVGQRHGDRFYPEISGVARSYDYYPYEGSTPSDGVVSLAFGLGKTIVDGGLCWTYSPARPAAPPPFSSTRDLLKNTQTRFWSVNMGSPPAYDPVREAEFLLHVWLDEARADGTLALAASTYDADSDRIRPGVAREGPLVLDFAGLRGGTALRFNDSLRHVLSVAREAVGHDVEIEFALTRDGPAEPSSHSGDGGAPTTPGGAEPARLGLLQVRPMARPGSAVPVAEEELTAGDVVLASTCCLGNGSLDTIDDVVYLKPDAFAAEHTRVMAAELATFNQALVRQGRRYLLIGFGRWGSSEPWLGVPVVWGQIAGAAAIVEAACAGMEPDMSQGSHFFHNLIGFHVLYLPMPKKDGRRIDWGWLEAQTIIGETRFVRHVRTPRPLHIRVDGRSRRGVVTRGTGGPREGRAGDA